MGVEMAEEQSGGGGGAWAAIARKEAAVEPKLDIPSLLSVAGLKTVVVDANALIGGGVKLAGVADQFFSIREVLDEVRDPASRFYLATLPVTIRCLEPSDEALAAVIKFSRATGDFQSLSHVDLKLIALAYSLEAEVHGTAHLRARPPPLVVTPSTTHRQKDPPGWGTVENPEEWEGIEEEVSVKTKSRILGVKPLDLENSQVNIAGDAERQFQRQEGLTSEHILDGTPLAEEPEDASVSVPQEAIQQPIMQDSRLTSEGTDSGRHGGTRKPSKSKLTAAEKQARILEGKVNFAEGVDASKGQVDEDGDDWQRAACRTTRRNFLKREAKRSAKKQAAESANAELPYIAGDEDGNSGVGNESQVQTESAELARSDTDPANQDGCPREVAISLDEDDCLESRELDQEDIRLLEGGDDDATSNAEDDATSNADDVASNGDEASSLQTDGVESEQSWTVGPMWKSSIACMTADYAMQNVLLQIGLRLLSTTGRHIQELNKWVLKCQACNRVTSDVSRIFCPKCGNGGTLFKLSVTVGQNGSVHAGRTRRINLRGTRYSIPKPKGGREGAAQNPILREDQLPNKLLHPRAKKKANDSDDYSSNDVIFTVPYSKRDQKLAGVKTAAAIFGGRRNPNERRGARKH